MKGAIEEREKARKRGPEHEKNEENRKKNKKKRENSGLFVKKEPSILVLKWIFQHSIRDKALNDTFKEFFREENRNQFPSPMDKENNLIPNEEEEMRIYLNYLEQILSEHRSEEWEEGLIVFRRVLISYCSEREEEEQEGTFKDEMEVELFSQDHTSSKKQTKNSTFYITLLLDWQKQAVLHHFRKLSISNMDQFKSVIRRVFPKTGGKSLEVVKALKYDKTQFEKTQKDIREEMLKLVDGVIEVREKSRVPSNQIISQNDFTLSLHNYLMSNNSKSFVKRVLKALDGLKETRPFSRTFLQILYHHRKCGRFKLPGTKFDEDEEESNQIEHREEEEKEKEEGKEHVEDENESDADDKKEKEEEKDSNEQNDSDGSLLEIYTQAFPSTQTPSTQSISTQNHSSPIDESEEEMNDSEKEEELEESEKEEESSQSGNEDQFFFTQPIGFSTQVFAQTQRKSNTTAISPIESISNTQKEIEFDHSADGDIVMGSQLLDNSDSDSQTQDINEIEEKRDEEIEKKEDEKEEEGEETEDNRVNEKEGISSEKNDSVEDQSSEEEELKINKKNQSKKQESIEKPPSQGGGSILEDEEELTMSQVNRESNIFVRKDWGTIGPTDEDRRKWIGKPLPNFHIVIPLITDKIIEEYRKKSKR
eukprot:TRINITY_DN3971_c0_g1_i2.p1 TRINITY_DN3971_c0_g1~~TRINITY_DN3971_c0_g1_i2.p1  ORF type:complete len:650 (-),score=291.96 TRINITY_DN3971_c0_g1_i2:59-2008(-)